MKLKTVAMTGVLSLAGLGLIGVGAHAAWTATTTASQQITSSALSIGLSAADATCNTVDPNNSASCINLSLEPYEVTSSSFDSGPITVTMTDNSDVTPTYEAVYAGDTVGGAPGSAGLASETYLCMTSDNMVIYNGLLSAEPAYPNPITPGAAGAYTLPSPGSPDTYVLEFYAGDASTLCGNVQPFGAPVTGPNPAAIALDNTAENGVITPYVTLVNNA